MRIGVLTGGGDAPGLNAAIRAVARRAFAADDTVIGIRNGWAGMLDGGDSFEIVRRDVSGLLPVGGTMLGSSRTNPRKREGGLQDCLATLAALQLDALVAIGGDDTLSVAAWLAEQGAPVTGVPKTMDNDLSATEYCIGFDSAVSIVTEALDRLHTTAASHHRVMVVEVMGRDTGWVGLMGGLAGGADMILIPEFPVTLDEVVTHVNTRRERGSDFSIIVVAEGFELAGAEKSGGDSAPTDAFGHVQLSRRGIADQLATAIEERTGHETRTTVLGHTQRGGSPTAYDRIWATHVGSSAYDILSQGRWGWMPVVQCGAVHAATIAEVASEQRRVPAALYELAKVFY